VRDQTEERAADAATLRITALVAGTPSLVPPAAAEERRRTGRFRPSAERSMADRERRHRERAIAAWLRDLSR